jgi:Fe-S cluster assembly protein SufD
MTHQTKTLELSGGENTLTLFGEGELSITGHGHLTLSLSPNTSFTIISSVAANQSLNIECKLSPSYGGVGGGFNDHIKLHHHLALALGATYTERLALKVSGHLDLLTEVTHLAKSSSKLTTKLVLNDGAQAIIRGTIIIDANAGGSIASERQDALLLGTKAEARLLPVLQVANHDVSCKHGATVGHVDQNALFYLQSRGLDDAGSEQVLADAFLNS